MMEAMTGDWTTVDWIALAFGIAGWVFILWLMAWSPRRLLRLVQGLFGFLMQRATGEANPCQEELDEAMACVMRQVERVPSRG